MSLGRLYGKEEVDKIYEIFKSEGSLFFIKRTDTNEYFYEPFNLDSGKPHRHTNKDTDVAWSETIGTFQMTGAFLTEKDAERMNNFDVGGCRHCGHGSTPIPTIVEEVKFVKKNY